MSDGGLHMKRIINPRAENDYNLVAKFKDMEKYLAYPV
jgi:hypothetical protein